MCTLYVGAQRQLRGATQSRAIEIVAIFYEFCVAYIRYPDALLFEFDCTELISRFRVFQIRVW